MAVHERNAWRKIFGAYGMLSLSSMAGMGLGGSLFVLATLWNLVRGWKVWGRAALLELIPFLWPSVFLFFAAFLSLAASQIWPPLGEFPAHGFTELKKFHYFLYPPAVALVLLLTSDQLERHPFWKIWGGMGIFCGILALLQFFGRDLFPEPWLAHRFFRTVGGTNRFHAQGLMFFHLSFASCLTFVAVAGWARVLWPLSWDNRKSRIFWFTVALAGALSVYFSYSRTGQITLAVVLVFLGFLKRPLLGVSAAGLALLLGVVLWWESPSLRDRFIYNRPGNAERMVMWESGWEMFKDRPITGFGFSHSAEFTPIYSEKILGHKAEFTSHPHNNILDFLAATGILGLVGFLWWSLSLLWWSWRSFRSSQTKWLPAAALAGLLGFQLNGLTQVNFWDGKSQHTLMLWAGVALALAVKEKRRET